MFRRKQQQKHQQTTWIKSVRLVALIIVAEGMMPNLLVASFSQHNNPAMLVRHQARMIISSVNDDGDNTSMLAENLASSASGTTSAGGDNDYSFFDEASIYVRAGSGGQGSSTYKKAKKSQNGIPDGGAGGKGGNIVLQLDDSLNTLAGLSRRALRPNAFGGGGGAASSKRLGHIQTSERLLSFRADGGRDGGRMYNNGACGEDCFVRVPPGTVVSYEMEQPQDEREEQEGSGDHHKEEEESDEGAPIEYDLREAGTLTFEEPVLVVARGGRGGDGTATFKGNKGKKRAAPTVSIA
jgi:GTPase involved in cell partitioning and DNA repair